MIIFDDNGTIAPDPYENKYLWMIKSFNDPPWARTRMYRMAYVDPIITPIAQGALSQRKPSHYCPIFQGKQTKLSSCRIS
jgi:hypothetical protein